MASIRNFIISFLISVVLFSVIAYFGVDYVVAIMNQSDDSADDGLNDDELSRLTSDATGILNLLLIGTDEYQYTSASDLQENENANGFTVGDMVKETYEGLTDVDLKNYDTKIVFMTLVSFNSYRQQVTVTAFPAEMTVAANDSEIGLADAYYFAQNELYGLDKNYFVNAISAAVGMQIDYSATIDIDDYVKVADNMGGLSVRCPENDSESGITAGQQTLSSEQLHRLITKDDYQDNRSKTQFMTNVTTAALDRICSTAYYINADEAFERISPMLNNTEFDETALAQWKSLIFSYKFYTAETLIPIGTYETVDGETVFNIDRNGTVNYFKQYMQNDDT